MTLIIAACLDLLARIRLAARRDLTSSGTHCPHACGAAQLNRVEV
jgi:hypothetical protein